MSAMSSFPARKRGASPMWRINCPMTCRRMPLLQTAPWFPSPGRLSRQRVRLRHRWRWIRTVDISMSSTTPRAISRCLRSTTPPECSPPPVCRAPPAAARMPWPSTPGIRYLYVTNLASNNVSAFAIDAGTGLLTELGNSPFAVGAEPTSLKIDANGSFLYVANFKGGNVTVLSIDPASGSLSAIPGSPFGAGAGALSIALDPAGTFAYVANETAATVSEYSIAASGALSAVSGSPLATGSSPESLAVDPTGRYLYAANVTAKNHVQQYSITPSSGALAVSGAPVAAGTFPHWSRARSVRPIRLRRQRQLRRCFCVRRRRHDRRAHPRQPFAIRRGQRAARRRHRLTHHRFAGGTWGRLPP